MRAIQVITLVLAGCAGNDVDERLKKGVELVFENQFEDAESHFLALARDLANSEEPSAGTSRAKALFHAGQIDHLYLDQPRRAVSRLREALKASPDGNLAFEARREIATIFYTRLQDYRSAAEEFERLVSENVKREGIAAFQYRLAQCYFLLREFDQSRAEARLLVEKWPKDPLVAEALLLIANSYYLENRLNEAVEAHLKLLASNPDVPIRARSLFELGMCYSDLSDKANAERYLLLSLKDHPRPDLVQMQLRVLRERIENEDLQAKPLSYAAESAGGHARAEVKREGHVESMNANTSRPSPRPESESPTRPAAKPSSVKPSLAKPSEPAAKPSAVKPSEPAAKPSEPAAKPSAVKPSEPAAKPSESTAKPPTAKPPVPSEPAAKPPTRSDAAETKP